MSDLPEKIGPVPVDKPWHQLRDFMAKKAGPLPIWAWTGLGVATVAGVVLLKGKLPGLGAVTGQPAQTPPSGGGGDTGGAGSGADVLPPPAASQPPGGGSTPPPPAPPPLQSGSGAGDVPLTGQQAGGTGGVIAPTPPHVAGIATRQFYDPTAYHDPYGGMGAPVASNQAQKEILASGGADYSTAAHYRPGLTGLSKPAPAPPAYTSLEGHPGKQADDLLTMIPSAASTLNNVAHSAPARRGGPQSL